MICEDFDMYCYLQEHSAGDTTHSRQRLLKQNPLWYRLCEGLDPKWRSWCTALMIWVPTFEWWNEPLKDRPIMEIVQKEFKMYLHHHSQSSTAKEFEWLPDMIHSIGQQKMRTDPIFYRQNVGIDLPKKGVGAWLCHVRLSTFQSESISACWIMNRENQLIFFTVMLYIRYYSEICYDKKRMFIPNENSFSTLISFTS